MASTERNNKKKPAKRAEQKGYIVSETIAPFGAKPHFILLRKSGVLEGGARHEVVGGIGPKGRSFRDYISLLFPFNVCS